MLEDFKVIDRNKFSPIRLCIGDSIAFVWRQAEKSLSDGWLAVKEKVLLDHKITAEHAMMIDEAVLFEAKFEGKRAIGMLALEAGNVKHVSKAA